MMDLSIEPALPTMAETLATIHAESFANAAWTLEQISDSLALHTTRGWIACENRQPTGFILCQIVGDQAEILTFCVRPQSQRRHIGKQLLQQTLAAARGEGVKTIFLEVAADNITACALYEKLGFTINGRRKNYYRRDTAVVDAIRYARNI